MKTETPCYCPRCRPLVVARWDVLGLPGNLARLPLAA